jgi:hypothetical protein
MHWSAGAVDSAESSTTKSRRTKKISRLVVETNQHAQLKKKIFTHILRIMNLSNGWIPALLLSASAVYKEWFEVKIVDKTPLAQLEVARSVG